MKLRETNLKEIVMTMFGLSNLSIKLSFSDLSPEQKAELTRVYRSLGGCLENAPLRFGPCDIVTPNFIIELDEEQHFNRYRKLTLQSVIYDNYPWFDTNLYNSYCDDFEGECLKKAGYGGYWENTSTVKQFGAASDKGDFSGNGSPRWKQRAFYDFCKDLAGIVAGIPIFRLSIYDVIVTQDGASELGKALERNIIEEVTGFLQTKIVY